MVYLTQCDQKVFNMFRPFYLYLGQDRLRFLDDPVSAAWNDYPPCPTQSGTVLGLAACPLVVIARTTARAGRSGRLWWPS